MSKLTIYDIATQNILQALEKGTVPWKKPWVAGYVPQNLVSRKGYRGANAILLNHIMENRGYDSPFFLSLKQIKEKEGKLKEGAKSCPVFFFKTLLVTGEAVEDGEETTASGKRIGFWRYYNVFNLAETEGIEAPELDLKEHQPLEQAETLIKNWKNKPIITTTLATDEAYYTPATDCIAMPDKALFHTIEEYYQTIFHESGHATGHPKRLNRFTEDAHPFGNTEYSKEELVAEITAGMLMATCGIHNQEIIENNAAYIESWAKALKDNKKWILIAASQAQKAADMIQNISYSKETEKTEAETVGVA